MRTARGNINRQSKGNFLTLANNSYSYFSSRFYPSDFRKNSSLSLYLEHPHLSSLSPSSLFSSLNFLSSLRNFNPIKSDLRRLSEISTDHELLQSEPAPRRRPSSSRISAGGVPKGRLSATGLPASGIPTAGVSAARVPTAVRPPVRRPAASTAIQQ